MELSPPSNENEMAANANDHRSSRGGGAEPEDEMHSGNSNRCRLNRTFSWTALIAGLAVVGTVTVVSLASGKTSISSSSSLQVQEAPAGYEIVKVGFSGRTGSCIDCDGAIFPNVAFDGVTTADDCADKCKCVDDGTVTFVGFHHSPTNGNPPGNCVCSVSNPITVDLNKFKTACSADRVNNFPTVNRGSGPVGGVGNLATFSCYKPVGGGTCGGGDGGGGGGGGDGTSKSGKSKSSKAPKSTN